MQAYKETDVVCAPHIQKELFRTATASWKKLLTYLLVGAFLTFCLFPVQDGMGQRWSLLHDAWFGQNAADRWEKVAANDPLSWADDVLWLLFGCSIVPDNNRWQCRIGSTLPEAGWASLAASGKTSSVGLFSYRACNEVPFEIFGHDRTK